MNPFEGQLVRLAPLERGSLPDFTRWLRDYDVQRFLGMLPVPMTDDAEAAWFEEAVKHEGTYTFSIRVLADDRLIGNCGLFGFDWKNRFAEFGILIGEKDAWGHGYGTDAARLILRFGFDELNLNRIWLRVYDFNPRAVRAYEKAGYVHEGTYRQALYREGAYHDIHVMSMLRDEWHTQRSG
jgi:RimJ/RimL family protein N-acetyltransferase